MTSSGSSSAPTIDDRIRNAWLGRISGCMLGKPVEMMSMMTGHSEMTAYLARNDALPLRDYVPLETGTMVEMVADACRDRLRCSVPDDDINYSVLGLMMLEDKGLVLTTEDVGRAWLNYLPGAMVFTAEREAYVRLLDKAGMGFSFGAPAEFDLAECSDHEFNDWIGAQIRADLYGWVLPGRPEEAADLARRDAELSHRAEGVYGAQAVAAMGAAIGGGASFADATETAMALLPAGSDCVAAMVLGRDTAAAGDGPEAIHRRYEGMSPVHTVNNLALVVWGLLRAEADFSAAIGDTVAAGWDTDCNGATVGALWGLSGREIPAQWTDPWQGRVEVTLAGIGELGVDDLVARTLAVVDRLA